MEELVRWAQTATTIQSNTRLKYPTQKLYSWTQKSTKARDLTGNRPLTCKRITKRQRSSNTLILISPLPGVQIRQALCLTKTYFQTTLKEWRTERNISLNLIYSREKGHSKAYLAIPNVEGNELSGAPRSAESTTEDSRTVFSSLFNYSVLYAYPSLLHSVQKIPVSITALFINLKLLLLQN